METRCMSCMRIKESRPHCEHCGFDERTQNSTHQLPVGTVVGGQYILGKVLGQGGFGITYIGWDTVLNQRVAVKEYFPSGYAGRNSTSNTVTSYDSVHNHDFENNKKRFLREAESLAKLWKVPQIVKVLRHFEENGTAYIAMEFIEGDDLRKHMKKRGRPLTVQETLDILGPVMDALEHVHKAQLVHRDISPDNIMLLPDGSAKLLDFGAARYVQNADAEKDRNTSTQAILKHGFAPPEQYSSHGALGPWTDVYAMCGTIYYCLTGKVPPEAMTRSVEGAAMDWNRIPGLTKRQKAALEKGMALQPDKRTGSIRELYQQLTGKSPEKKGKTLTLIGAAAALAAVAIGFFLIRNPKPAGEVEMAKPTAAAIESAASFETKAASETLAGGEPTETAPSPPEETAGPETIPLIPEESIPSTIPEERPEPGPGEAPWRKNILIPTHAEFETAELVAWWLEHEHLYTASTAFYYPFDYNSETYLIHPNAMEDYVGTLPLYNSRIPRGNVIEVFFLDTFADAPADAWDVSVDQDRSVLAWTVSTTDDMHTLYIAGKGGINGAQACENLFYGFIGLQRIHFNGSFYTEDATSMKNMFFSCKSLTMLDLGSFNTSNIISMRYMFQACSGLSELNLSSFDTTNVTDMASMFQACSGLSKLDLSSFDTSKVMDMNWMFANCSKLTQLDLRSFNTSKVTDIHSMFTGCSNLTQLDLRSFNTSEVTNMSEMFYGCSGITQLDLSSFDTSKVTDMRLLFANCSNLTQLDLRNFNTSKVTDMSYLFYGCSGLTRLDLDNFNTSSVTNMFAMFYCCSQLTELDLRSFDTSKVVNMSYMFAGCSKLEKLDLSSFDVSNVEDKSYMFNGCFKLPYSVTAIAN